MKQKENLIFSFYSSQVLDLSETEKIIQFQDLSGETLRRSEYQYAILCQTLCINYMFSTTTYWSLARQRLTLLMKPSPSATYFIQRLHCFGLELPQLFPEQRSCTIRSILITDFNTTINDMRWFEYCQSSALSPNLRYHLPHILALNTQHHYVNRVSSKALSFICAYALSYLNDIRGSLPLISSMHPHVNVPPKRSSKTLKPSQFTKVWCHPYYEWAT